MRLLRPSYSTNKFLICLESAKLSYQTPDPIYEISNVDSLNTYVKILTIVLGLKKKHFQEQYRVRYILDSYRYYTDKEVQKKYTERFIYNYIKSHSNTVHDNINKKKTKLKALRLKALTCIYLIYKFLQSRYPVYAYFLLIINS